jgi:hypothetical protein
MLPPDAVAAFSRSAGLHAQARIERLELDDEASGGAPTQRLSGTIVRVFRGDPSWVGRQADLEFPRVELGEGESSEGLTPHQWQTVERLKFIEAYLSAVSEAPARLQVVVFR